MVGGFSNLGRIHFAQSLERGAFDQHRPTALLSRIGSIDTARRSARLADGRLLLLPFADSPGAPPIDQIRGVLHTDGDANLQIAELPRSPFSPS